MWCAPQPLDDLRGRWQVCSPDTVAAFSAVGYFFARDLNRAMAAPVGIIDSTSGGTAAEAWISQSYLESDPRLKVLVKPDPGFYRTVEQYAADWTDYQQAQAEKRQPMPPYPKSPFRGWGYPAASFYNAMIAPLIPFAAKGVLWYQGEARTGRPHQYGEELTALITDWRGRWRQGDLPFLVVQLPRITGDWYWPLTREQQARVAGSVKNVGLIVTVDLPDADLHPRIKEPIGQRLALAAQAIAYGRDLVHSGPVYESMRVEGAEVRLHFRSVGGGLVASDGGALKGFVIAGEDRVFYPARAVVDGDTVAVSAKDVPNPQAVRYAFENNPTCNLSNRAGLPASPFRTDEWPVEVKP
jgi:sialate O-acetylesterase